MLPCPFALIPLTEPPFSSAPVNTPNPQSLTISDTFCNSIPNLKSGLSEPNLSIASCHVILWIGSFTSTSRTSLKRYARSLSLTSITSSTSTNDNSISICVNSGCLSALKSSSLKHLAICIYLSYPEHISICLKSCGDCGSA